MSNLIPTKIITDEGIIAIKNEIRVEPNVTFKPGIIKLKAFRYSSPVTILKTI